VNAPRAAGRHQILKVNLKTSLLHTQLRELIPHKFFQLFGRVASLLGKQAGGAPILRRGFLKFARHLCATLVGVLQSRQLRFDPVAVGENLFDALPVFTLEPVDEGQPVFEIFQSFESYAFNYYNAVQGLKDELRMIEGEFVMQLIKDNYIRITLISFNKQEYHVEVNLERYPNLQWIFTPDLEKVLSKVEDFMARYSDAKSKPGMMTVLHDLSWGIDKTNRLAFDYKVLVNNVTESISDLKIDADKKLITGCINGELKTASMRFEFVADFSKGYPEKPPEIALSPFGDVDQSVLDKLETFISESGATWSNTSFFIDLLNQIHMAIFKSSIVTCVLCHKLFCPTCDESLYLPKGKQGKTCFVECANCHRPYHKHCFEKTIQTIGKCAVCMQSFVAQDNKGEKSNLELDFKI
nr:hypothetical protein [Candidatus Sigynarchaeota archaeon]